MPRPRTIITRDFYDKLVIIFRESPGNLAHAARRAPCDRSTAKRAWELGWPQWSFPPIRETLADDRTHAAALAKAAALRQAEEADATRERARAESVEALAQERQMLKAARGDVLAALVIAAELIPAMRLVAKAVGEHCKPKADGSPPDIPLGAAMSVLTRHATLIQKAIGATEAIVQLSRLDRGASTVNLGGVTEDITLEQAVEELEALEEVLGAARSRGLLPAAPPT